MAAKGFKAATQFYQGKTIGMVSGHQARRRSSMIKVNIEFNLRDRSRLDAAIQRAVVFCLLEHGLAFVLRAVTPSDRQCIGHRRNS
jgi:hypothetical protein